MKRHLKYVLYALLALLLAAAASGCVVHARPAVVVDPGPVVVTTAPARVYYSGQWLYYRSDGYYFYDGGTWVVASAVPSWVRHYHRPLHRSVHVYYPGYRVYRGHGHHHHRH